MMIRGQGDLALIYSHRDFRSLRQTSCYPIQVNLNLNFILDDKSQSKKKTK